MKDLVDLMEDSTKVRRLFEVAGKPSSTQKYQRSYERKTPQHSFKCPGCGKKFHTNRKPTKCDDHFGYSEYNL
jgi:hypothetical protein